MAMQRDFKIGLIVGLVLLVVAMGWISTRESFSPQARLSREQSIPLPGTSTLPMPSPSPASTSKTSGMHEPDVPLPFEKSTPVKTNRIFDLPGEQTKQQPKLALNPQQEKIPVLKQPVAKKHPAPVKKVEKKAPVKKPRYHVVQSGQNLSTISKQYYGSSTKWKRILDANPKIIRDPDKIRIGMRLLIPYEE